VHQGEFSSSSGPLVSSFLGHTLNVVELVLLDRYDSSGHHEYGSMLNIWVWWGIFAEVVGAQTNE